MMLFSVQTVQIVQAPSLNFLPGDAGEEKRETWLLRRKVGLERSEAVELNEVIERFEQFYMRFDTTLQFSKTPAERVKI